MRMPGSCLHYWTVICCSFLSLCISLAASQQFCQDNHWESGVHPHPIYCDRYVLCINFNTQVVACPAGTSFDASVKACVSSSINVQKCNDAFTTVAPVTAPAGENFCQQNNWQSGKHPYPLSCDRYIECRNFATFILYCSTGQLYDPIRELCVDSSTAPNCNDAHTTPSTVAQCQDTSKGDILFLLDSSSSIMYQDYVKQLTFAADIASRFPVGPNNVQFSVVVFSIEAKSEFSFNKYSSQSDLRQAIMNTSYVGSTTNTYLALQYALKTSFTAAEGTRANVPHIVVVMTDGESSDFQLTRTAAMQLKSSGVTVLAIGIGSFNRLELDVIATDPQHVFQVGSFDVLNVLHHEVTSKLCTSVNTPCSSMTMADIIFVLDASSSITGPNFREELRFAANLTQNFAIGEHDVRFAALTFSSTVNKLFDLNTYSDHNAIAQSLMGATYLSSGTNTALALQAISSNSMFESIHGGRPNVTKLVIVMTDGQSDSPSNTAMEATRLKGKGYHMISIGIGNAVYSELMALSTDIRNVFYAQSFDVLHRLEAEVYAQTCQIPSLSTNGAIWDICSQQTWSNGIHAHPFDCTKFIECTFLHTAILTCPPGLVYDPLKETCMNKHEAISCLDYNDYNPFPGLVLVPSNVTVNYDVTTLCHDNNWSTGLYSHPYDCAFYISCNNGVTSVKNCPANTAYDPTTSSCRDKAIANKCNDATSHPGVHSSTSARPPNTSLDIRSICYDYLLADGIYPDPSSCVHYVECSNGDTYHMSCPDGLEFNIKNNVCDDVHNINCQDNFNYIFVHAG